MKKQNKKNKNKKSKIKIDLNFVSIKNDHLDQKECQHFYLNNDGYCCNCGKGDRLWEKEPK